MEGRTSVVAASFVVAAVKAAADPVQGKELRLDYSQQDADKCSQQRVQVARSSGRA